VFDVECDFQFDFHPVGQGLFYSGRVNGLNFVYDCGSDNYGSLLSAIEQYDLAKKLDLLIISHLHEDHIHGVKDLLKKTGGVKEVILPYLHPAERLMVAASFAAARRLTSLSPDYIGFLADPASLFGKDTRVTYVTRHQSEDPEPPDTVEAPKESGWIGKPILSSGQRFPDMHKSSMRGTCHTDCDVWGNPFWRFRFFCQPGKKPKVDISKALGMKEIQPADIARIISNQLRKIKKVYLKAFGGSAGQNFTSLLCCHGPTSPNARLQTTIRGSHIWRHGHSPYGTVCECLPQSCNREYCTLLPLQMLTGDAEIRIGQGDYHKHFRSEFGKIGLFQIPHHGAKRNWRKKFLLDQPDCLLWVASSSISNGHGHPSMTVAYDIFEAGKGLVWCNEANGLTMQGHCVT